MRANKMLKATKTERTLRRNLAIAAICASALLLASCESEPADIKSKERVEASAEPATQSEESAPTEASQSRGFVPTESSESLIAIAEKFRGCELATTYIGAYAAGSANPRAKQLLQEAQVLNKISISYAVLAGYEESAARDLLKSKNYAENEIVEKISNGQDVDSNRKLLGASYNACVAAVKNASAGEDPTLAHIVKNLSY